MQLDSLLAAARNTVPMPAIAADLADAALSEGREGEALHAVLAAATRHGTSAALWQWVGLLYRGLDRQDEAIGAFQRAVQLDPGSARAMHGLAQSAMDAGLPASPLFERAALIAPSNGEVLLGRAAARVAEGDLERAVAELDALLEDNPRWIRGHEHIAHIRWLSGDRATFIRSLERALRRNPREIGLWAAGQRLLMQSEAFELALEMIERGRRIVGDGRVFDEHEAIVSSPLGRRLRADLLFERLAQGADAGFAVHFVRHLLRTGRPETALREAKRWLDGPASRHFWPYIGLAWRLLGDARSDWLEDGRLIGIYSIADRLPPLDALAAHLRALQVQNGQQLDQSVRGGTQTIGPLLSRVEPMIRALRAAIVSAIETYVAQLPPPDPHHPLLAVEKDRGPPRFSGSWSVRLTGPGHHTNHVHSEGWLSSALYVALPTPAERGPAPAGSLVLGEPPQDLCLDLPPIRMIEPRPGELVLFPSVMWHGTRPFMTGERLTVAFDVARPSAATAARR